MKNKNIWLAVALAAVLVIAGLLYLAFRPAAVPAIKTAATVASPEAKALPHVVTLYQKGEGESDLAVFVSNELARELKGKALFRLVNVEDDPQMAEFFGVTAIPSVVIQTASGKLYSKHEGYMEKAAIVAAVKKLEKD